MDAKLASYMNAIVDSFTVGQLEMRTAFERMRKKAKPGRDVQSLQLLALRRYLRVGGARLVAQWPWTSQQQKTTYSGQIAQLMVGVKKVKDNFELDNPGLTLNYTGARDLNRQAGLWVDNGGVNLAAAGFRRDALRELTQSAYASNPDDVMTAKFRRFLKTHRVNPEPSNAAPGLSDHGQMKAVDFIVEKAGQPVATISKAKIAVEWASTGYAAKLKAATRDTGLVGPLMTPYEPWHYGIP